MSKPMMVSLSKIQLTGDNHREDIRNDDDYESMRASVAAGGVISPIVLRENPETGGFDLVAGERRLCCAIDLELTEIPANVLEPGEKADNLVAALVENLHRKDPTPLEEAKGFQHLIDEAGLTPEGAAQALNLPARRVTERLPILLLSAKMQKAIGSGAVPLRAVAPLAHLLQEVPVIGRAVQAAILGLRLPHGGTAPSPMHASMEYLKDPNAYVAACATKQNAKIIHIPAYPGLRIKGDETWLSTSARAHIDEMNARVPEGSPNALYALRIPDELLSALQQDGSGALVLSDEYDRIRGVAFEGAAWLTENSEALIAADYARWREEKQADAAASVKAKRSKAEQAERRAELDRERAHVRACEAANEDLGIALMKGLAEVELTKDVALFFALSLFTEPGGGGYAPREVRVRSVGRLAARGLGYVFPLWRTTEKTKAGKDKTIWPKDVAAEREFWAWLDAKSRTPEEILGRALITVAAARYSLEDAVPKGERTDYVEPSYSSERDAALDRITKKLIPASVRKLRNAAKAGASA